MDDSRRNTAVRPLATDSEDRQAAGKHKIAKRSVFGEHLSGHMDIPKTLLPLLLNPKETMNNLRTVKDVINVREMPHYHRTRQNGPHSLTLPTRGIRCCSVRDPRVRRMGAIKGLRDGEALSPSLPCRSARTSRTQRGRTQR